MFVCMCMCVHTCVCLCLCMCIFVRERIKFNLLDGYLFPFYKGRSKLDILNCNWFLVFLFKNMIFNKCKHLCGYTPTKAVAQTVKFQLQIKIKQWWEIRIDWPNMNTRQIEIALHGIRQVLHCCEGKWPFHWDEGHTSWKGGGAYRRQEWGWQTGYLCLFSEEMFGWLSGAVPERKVELRLESYIEKVRFLCKGGIFLSLCGLPSFKNSKISKRPNPKIFL